MEKSSTIILCERAKAASRELGKISDEKINEALLLMAENLIKNTAKNFLKLRFME